VYCTVLDYAGIDSRATGLARVGALTMPQVYLVATLSQNGCTTEIRYLHGERIDREESQELCDGLNAILVTAEYRVVDE
jgi:hypothetical protein